MNILILTHFNFHIRHPKLGEDANVKTSTSWPTKCEMLFIMIQLDCQFAMNKTE